MQQGIGAVLERSECGQASAGGGGDPEAEALALSWRAGLLAGALAVAGRSVRCRHARQCIMGAMPTTMTTPRPRTPHLRSASLSQGNIVVKFRIDQNMASCAHAAGQGTLYCVQLPAPLLRLRGSCING